MTIPSPVIYIDESGNLTDPKDTFVVVAALIASQHNIKGGNQKVVRIPEGFLLGYPSEPLHGSRPAYKQEQVYGPEFNETLPPLH